MEARQGALLQKMQCQLIRYDGSPQTKKKYLKESRRLSEQFGYKSRMQVPKVIKLTLNMARGKTHDAKVMKGRNQLGLYRAETQLRRPKSWPTSSCGSMPVDCGDAAWRPDVQMLDRLISIALRGSATSGISPAAFDGQATTTWVCGADHLPGDRLRQD